MDNTRPPVIMHIASGDLWAGAEVQLFTLVKVLHKEFHWPVSVVLLNHGRLQQELEAIGIDVIVLDEAKLNGLQILQRLVAIMRERQPAVVHTHRIKENVLGSLATLLAGRIPSIRTVHGASEHPARPWQVARWLIQSLDEFCGKRLQQKVIAVSPELADGLGRRFGRDRITVIENGIDIEATRSACPDRLTKARDPDSPFRVGFAGRLTPVKRVDLIIETAAWLRTHYPDMAAEFHIYGDGPLRQDLETLSQTLDMAAYVHFHGHTDSIQAKLCKLDALLLTSDHEGLPMVVLEAMAIGVPVVAHATGGLPHLLDDGRCGWPIGSQQAGDFAETLAFLATHPDDVHRKVSAAASRIAGHYSARHNADRYTTVYTGLAG